MYVGLAVMNIAQCKVWFILMGLTGSGLRDTPMLPHSKLPLTRTRSSGDGAESGGKSACSCGSCATARLDARKMSRHQGSKVLAYFLVSSGGRPLYRRRPPIYRSRCPFGLSPHDPSAPAFSLFIFCALRRRTSTSPLVLRTPLFLTRVKRELDALPKGRRVPLHWAVSHFRRDSRCF